MVMSPYRAGGLAQPKVTDETVGRNAPRPHIGKGIRNQIDVELRH